MNKAALFNFIVAKEDRTITVERSFQAPLAMVWSAWTEPDILCKWWAPKPYECEIRSMDFRAGGRCLYCMKGPQGDRHWAYFDYATVKPKSFYAGTDGFCDEQGNVNTSTPNMKWENNFSENDGGTLVQIKIHFTSINDLEAIIKMGFKEGFTQGLDQLDELLAKQ